MPDSVASSQPMLSPQMFYAQSATQRGSQSFSYGPYTVEIRYSLRNDKLTVRGQLSYSNSTTFANAYYFVLYGEDGWIVDFIDISPTGRFSFSPPQKAFYSVTLRISGEEYLLGALEL